MRVYNESTGGMLIAQVSLLALVFCLACSAARQEPAVGAASRRIVGAGMAEGRMLAALKEMARGINAGDAKLYASVYAPDAVITILGGSDLKGRDAIERYEVGLLEGFPGTRFAFRTVWSDGPLVVAHYLVNGRTAHGRPMGHEGLLFFRFTSSGLIAEERRYHDSMTPMAQVGLLGHGTARRLPALPKGMRTFTVKRSSEERENVSVVAAALAALSHGDAIGFLSQVRDDALIDELFLPEPYTGPTSTKRWLETWTKAVPSLSWTITAAHGIGDFVLLESILSGTLEGSLGPMTASSNPFAVHRAVVVQLEGRKIVRLLSFLNAKELAQAIGQWPPSSKR